MAPCPYSLKRCGKCIDCVMNSDFPWYTKLMLSMYHQTLENPQNFDEARIRSLTEMRLQPTHVNGTPTIFLMGLRRSGKTSAIHVLLHDLPSANTLHLEPTLTPKKYVWESFININILELPADHPSLDPAHPCNANLQPSFTNCTTIIWFIDAQDEYMDSIERLHTHITALLPTKPNLNFEVFIHKCDSVSDDFRTDIFRDIQTRVPEDLADAHIFNALLTFYQTSIYDKTLHEAFSRVIQKLIPELPTINSLIDSLCANSGYIKAYIFDTATNLYIASDTTPGSLPIYETCSDYLDMIAEFTAMYGWMERAAPDTGAGSVPGEYGVVSESLVTMERGGNGMCCREINKEVTVIAMLQREGPGTAKGKMDWNLGVFVRAVNKVLDITRKRAEEYRVKEGPYIVEEEEAGASKSALGMGGPGRR